MQKKCDFSVTIFNLTTNSKIQVTLTVPITKSEIMLTLTTLKLQQKRTKKLRRSLNWEKKSWENSLKRFYADTNIHFSFLPKLSALTVRAEQLARARSPVDFETVPLHTARFTVKFVNLGKNAFFETGSKNGVTVCW